MTAIVDTTRSGPNTVRPYPALFVRRILARTIDTVIAFVVSCVVVLPFTIGQMIDAVALGGFDSGWDFIGEWDPGAVAVGSVGRVVEQLQPVVLTTVYLQGLVMWGYDWLAHTLTGSTVGKAIARVRVIRHRGSEPTLVPGQKSREPFAKRAGRMALRSALVVGPVTLAIASLLAAMFAVDGASEAAEVFIALCLVLLITWFVGGVGLHGLVTGTRVVDFNWQELRQEAEQQFEHHSGHADDYLRKLQASSRVQQATSTLERDPRVRAGEDARSAVGQVREAYRQDGLRGVLESLVNRPPTSGTGGA